MPALAIAPLKGFSQLDLSSNPLTKITTDQSMISQYTCPCCSHVLLRHVRVGGLYWHCRHCYEEMPVLL